MKLSEIQCRNAKTPKKKQKLFDGEGLFLEVHSTGSKYWKLKYYFLEKARELSLGVYPQVSLKEAREKRYEARKLVEQGKDPRQQKKVEKLKQKISHANTFQSIAEEWHGLQAPRWTPRHGNYVLNRIKADLFPFIGDRPINEITAPEMLAVIRKIEARDAIDIAKRVLQTAGQVFRYAIVTGRAERDITRDLQGALKTRKAKNYNRLTEAELPDFLQKLYKYHGHALTRLALLLIVLTFVRSGEARGAKWDEFDLVKKQWRIPADRMKMGEMHIVPLSRQAIEVIEELQPISGHSQFVFPNEKTPTTFMSNNTLLYALYRMGYHNRATVHGFRATASTILNENGFSGDVIERQLAHAERNKVRASYNHAEYLKERTEMMDWWGQFVETQQTKDK